MAPSNSRIARKKRILRERLVDDRILQRLNKLAIDGETSPDYPYFTFIENDGVPATGIKIHTIKKLSDGALEIVIAYYYDPNDVILSAKANSNTLIISKNGIITTDVIFNKDRYDDYRDGNVLSQCIRRHHKEFFDSDNSYIWETYKHRYEEFCNSH